VVDACRCGYVGEFVEWAGGEEGGGIYEEDEVGVEAWVGEVLVFLLGHDVIRGRIAEESGREKCVEGL
jgi:hypothetical protein